MSSIYGNLDASRAADGDRGTCSHSSTQTSPWWRLELWQEVQVETIAITNADSNNYHWINGSVIRVGNSPTIIKNPICTVISTIPSGQTANFSCGWMEGRYMFVHIPGDQKTLVLCEVKIYGYFTGNLASDGSTTQSSTYDGWFAEKAIDGNRGLLGLPRGCSSTRAETNPWWRLDLNYVYSVSRVVVTNRIDCCVDQINGAEIRIGNSLENNGNNNPICAVIPAIPEGSYGYSCGEMKGRYVNLIIPGDMKTLTLCEVEVFGEEDGSPSGMVARPESDLEMSAMLSWAAERVGLQWNPPPCPEPSRLDDSQVLLRPRPGYIPKVPTTSFKNQVVKLQALPLEEADPALAVLCPVPPLRPPFGKDGASAASRFQADRLRSPSRAGARLPLVLYVFYCSNKLFAFQSFTSGSSVSAW
ncbi:uncharacterized protein LOC127961823 [Carassius gibelio]|uniref:uncharacterized protein LOC127961823 n=1 Tax=Carassius gibelio TaxID=101364 RepID=UPI0022777A38|nr:uncharacterized protein LOC127961823 [Carassius gibelio]